MDTHVALHLSTGLHRTFQNRSARGKNNAAADEGSTDGPKTAAQLADEAKADALMQQHREMRGPTLAELHSTKSAKQVSSHKYTTLQPL